MSVVMVVPPIDGFMDDFSSSGPQSGYLIRGYADRGPFVYTGGMDDLPLLDEPPRERADAARNRALVLQAAWRLYNHGGVEALTTDAVAQEAGVGKGTVYRRFRD